MKPLFLTTKAKSRWTHSWSMCPSAAKLKISLYFNYILTPHGAADGRHMAAHGRHMAAVGVVCGVLGKGMKSCVKHFIQNRWTDRADGLSGLLILWIMVFRVGYSGLASKKKEIVLDCFKCVFGL